MARRYLIREGHIELVERRRRKAVASFPKWDRDAYRARVGEEEAARRRGAIMAEQWGY
jgi:hypothetical protein